MVGRSALSGGLSPVLTQLHMLAKKGQGRPGAGLAGLLCCRSGERGCLGCCGGGGMAVISSFHGDEEMEPHFNFLFIDFERGTFIGWSL